MSAAFSSPVAAQDVAITGAETAGATPIQMDTGPKTIAAVMPCKNPFDAPMASSAKMCKLGDVFFVLTFAAGEGSANSKPFQSDFDAMAEHVRTSSQTVEFNSGMLGSMKMVTATQGPDPKFGLMKAVQLAPDVVGYAVAMLQRRSGDALPEKDKERARAFIASFEVID